MPGSDPAPTPRPADFRRYARKVWRMVEGQHRISTNRLVDSQDEQALLESLVEEVKPTLPAEARGLHYLLATPFRYGHRLPSRFRRAGERPGIFYASEHVETAVAEAAYWRLVFLSRSPGMALPRTTMEHSAFTIPVRLDRMIDLTRPPFAKWVASWSDPDDYRPCQDFAAAARRIEGQAIRYRSARDAKVRANLALLDPAGFAASTPKVEQSWHFRLDRHVLTAMSAFPDSRRLSFTFQQFGLASPH